MNTMLEPRKKVGTNAIKPFSISNALVGLQMGGVDEEVLEYFNYFSSLIPVEKACFLHVVNKPDIFNVYEMDSSPFSDVELDKDMLIKLGKLVKTHMKGNKELKINLDVMDGNPLEELLEKADQLKSDFLVIGQNTENRHHGILAKNLARQVWSNSMLIPDKAKLSLQNILVPVDFSIHSAEALRIAVAIRKRLPHAAKVTLVHVYEMPANYSAYRINEFKVKKMIEEDRVGALEQFIIEHVPEADRKNLDTALVNRSPHSIGHNLIGFAEQYGHDLIVMGAKGHSKLALLLMGSVTEKVFSHSQHIPVLIVK
ncbi:MAG: universal stress protein [Saprospiraceae bacterium]